MSDPTVWQLTDSRGTVVSCNWKRPMTHCKLGEGRTLDDAENAHRGLMDEVLKQWRENSARTINDATKAVEQCEVEENKPHLPLGVNPGDCFRVEGDMSIKLIPCPKEGE